MTTSLDPVLYKQHRGLIRHFRLAWPRIRQASRFERSLIRTFKPYGGEKGLCRWCGLPTQGRKKWHHDCVPAYQNATGQSLRNQWVGPNWVQNAAERPDCPCGAPGEELDHQDALVLAWTTGDPRRLIRALRLANLRWLCRTCHLLKTQTDLTALSEIRAKQTCLIGLIPHPGDYDRNLGKTDWILAEGGRAIRRNRKEFMAVKTTVGRRAPISFLPSLTTCPRCLASMKDQALPRDWYLDENQMVIETEKRNADNLSLRNDEPGQ